MAHIFYICADILYIGANISWARIFHWREYFMGANISWARIFHGREHFMGTNILVCADVSGSAHIGSGYSDMRRCFEMCAYIFDWKQIFHV